MNRITQQRTARRATAAAARNAFELGQHIVVSIGAGHTQTVGSGSTSHHKDWTTFDALEAAVASYGVPEQRYYIVDPVDHRGESWPRAYTSNNRVVVPGMRVRDYNQRVTTVTDEAPSIDGGGASGRPAVPWFHTANGGFFDGSRLLAL